MEDEIDFIFVLENYFMEKYEPQDYKDMFFNFLDKCGVSEVREINDFVIDNFTIKSKRVYYKI